MSYTPPVSLDMIINFVSEGYISPVSGEISADFKNPPIYTPPLSGELVINFKLPDSSTETGVVSGELVADFVDIYVPPESGSLVIGFGTYVPPSSGELVVNFIGGENVLGDETIVFVPSFISTNVFDANFGRVTPVAIPSFVSTSYMSVDTTKWLPTEGVQILNSGIGITEQFNILDAFGVGTSFLLNLPIVDSNYQLIKFQYGTFIDAIQIFLNEVKGILEGKISDNIFILRNSLIRGDTLNNWQMLLNSFPNDISGNQMVVQLLAEGILGNKNVKNTLSNDEIVAIQALTTVLDVVNYASSYLMIKQSLIDLGTVFYSFETNIYLDNILINKLVGNDTIGLSFSQDNIHNEISISSISQELFDLSDPNINIGTPRIEIHIGSRVLFFLLETRTGSGASFTLWGRDQTARDSSPWAVSKSVSLTAPQLASNVTASIPIYSAVDWDEGLYDWVLPKTFETEGTPSEILSAIAQEMGAVVRAQDDGSFLIRKRYTIRPINLESTSIDITYNSNKVVDFGHSVIVGDHYNKVTVTSTNMDSSVPTIEVESLDDETRYIGRTSFVKVFWVSASPKISGTYVTDGSIKKVIGPFTNGAFHEEFTEIVEFNDGIADTSYPIFELGEVEWIGDTGTIDEWSVYGKTLTLSDLEAWRLAKITYTVEFRRYELSGHNVEELLAVFYYTEFSNLSITVTTTPIAVDSSGNLIDKIGNTISTDNLIGDSSAAVERGKAWIDDNKYDRFEHSFKSPYNDLALDGNIAWIDCSRIGSSGNYYINDVGITISGSMVINTLKVIQWRI